MATAWKSSIAQSEASQNRKAIPSLTLCRTGGGKGAAIGAGIGGGAGVATNMATRGPAAEIPPETVLNFVLTPDVVVTEKQ